MTKNEFLDRSHSIHGYKYEYPNLSTKVLSTDDIDVVYNGIYYKQKVAKHIMGRSPEKNTPKKTTDQFKEEARIVWGNKYDYSLVEYNGALKKIKIIYDGVTYEQDAVSHLSGQAPEFRIKSIESFLSKAKRVHGDKYDYSQVKIKGSNDLIMIGYNGIFYLQRVYNHLSGACPENMKLAIRKSNGKFVKESRLVHDYKYNYDKTRYIKNNIKVVITCPIHGDFTQNPLSHIQGRGCASCNESKGEKEIAKFLKKNNINFDRQKKFPDCKNIFELPFDFYIDSMRMCVEFDGMQHFQPVEHFGGISTYETLKINDKIKNDYCEDNYINLIRIKYTDIDNIWQILWDNMKTFIEKKN